MPGVGAAWLADGGIEQRSELPTTPWVSSQQRSSYSATAARSSQGLGSTTIPEP